MGQTFLSAHLPGRWAGRQECLPHIDSRDEYFSGFPDHVVEGVFGLGYKIGLHLIGPGESHKGPVAIGAEMIHAGRPVGVQGSPLFPASLRR